MFFLLSVTSVTIPSSVTSIGSSAFSGTNLKKTIWLTNTPPTNYTAAAGAVNYVANDQYRSLKNTTVYPYLSSLFEVDGIKYVPVSPSERTCDAIDCVFNSTATHTRILSTVTYRGVMLNVLDVKPYVCFNNKYIKDLVVDNDGIIATSAFENCDSLETVDLGKNISAIGYNAFKSCVKLKSIIIPDCTTTLGASSFSGCSTLNTVLVGTNVKEIGTYTFQNCKSLPSILIPKATTDIKDYVFSGCTCLKTVLIDDRESELKLGSNGSSPLFVDCPLDSVYIGGDITYNTGKSYGYSPFYGNKKLRSITITDKETEISPNEFYGCSNLKNVRIGDGVTTIGDWAFSGCSSLTYFAFGTKMATIGKEAFSDCTSVGRIISKAATPPACGSQALDDINKWDCQLSVPEGCLSAYQAANQWKDFFFTDEQAMEEGIEDTPFNPGTEKCATPIIELTDGHLTFSCETEGVEYRYEVTNTDVKKGNGEDVALGGIYKVSVIATKPGYDDSNVATLEFSFGGGEPCDSNHDGVVDVADIATIIDKMASQARMQDDIEE